MFRWLLLSSLLALSQCNVFQPKPSIDGRIVGGFPVGIRYIPYQVSLQKNGHFCGGTLVSPTIVITAAHCTVGKTAAEVTVRIGSDYHYRGGVVISVSSIVQHPNYDPATKNFDIAIITLSTPETYTRAFPKLPTCVGELEDGKWALVSGWGETENPNESNGFLRAVYVMLINQAECNTLYSGAITATQLCAGDVANGGIDSCQGDSGGPLTLNGYLIGVVSWGEGCAEPGFPGVYINVATVRQWIKDTANV